MYIKKHVILYWEIINQSINRRFDRADLHNKDYT